MIKIFIEGKNNKVPESDFLRNIVDQMGVSTDKYEIIHTDGYKNLLDADKSPFIGIIRSNTDIGGKNLVVFDADTEKNNGGFTKRSKELIDRKTALELEFDLFLWPDNKSDGDVELLMESIARKDLYPEFFDCFTKYEHCLSLRKADNGEPFYSTPNRKGKLHTYFNAIPTSKTKKQKFGNGVWRWTDKDIWDLDAPSLDPIKSFLRKHLIK